MTHFELKTALTNFLTEYKRAIIHFQCRYGKVCLAIEDDIAKIMFDDFMYLAWEGNHIEPSRIYVVKKEILNAWNIQFVEDPNYFRREVKRIREEVYK